MLDNAPLLRLSNLIKDVENYVNSKANYSFIYDSNCTKYLALSLITVKGIPFMRKNHSKSMETAK